MPHYNKITNIIIYICLFTILYFHAKYYMPFLSDDSLISLRYVNQLLDGNGLIWTDGQSVEGYSNLLWILLIACLGLLGIDLIDASRILGMICMSTVIIVVMRWFLYNRIPVKNIISLVVGLFFFCMAAPVAVWTIGGLEQPLYALLIAISIPLTILIFESETNEKRVSFWLSLVLGLMCITRLDGPLFSIAAFLSVYIGRYAGKPKQFFSHLKRLMIFPIFLYGGQIVFRFFYYGELIPNTALVKVSPSSHHFYNGLIYLLDGMWALFPFSFLAVIAIFSSIWLKRRRSRAIPLLVICLLWVPYLIFIGGDIFPAYRHFIPLIIVFIYALIEGTEIVLEYLNKKRLLITLILVLSIFLVSGVIFTSLQFNDDQNKRALSERWEWDGKVLGLLLKSAFSKQAPLLAVSAAGCIPYWSELPCVDMLGLNDYYIPRHPPENIGDGFLGHELGDGKYILERQPDIIIFHVGRLEAVFRSGIQMQKMKEFQDNYLPVIVFGRDPHDYSATIWINKQSDKIGIQKTPSEIIIPGFLISGKPNIITYLNESNKLVGSIHAKQPGFVMIEDVGDQNWMIEIKSSHPEVIISELQLKGTSLIVSLSTKSPKFIDIEEIILRKT